MELALRSLEEKFVAGFGGAWSVVYLFVIWRMEIPTTLYFSDLYKSVLDDIIVTVCRQYVIICSAAARIGKVDAIFCCFYYVLI